LACVLGAISPRIRWLSRARDRLTASRNTPLGIFRPPPLLSVLGILAMIFHEL
jgi:hypothetical protein